MTKKLQKNKILENLQKKIQKLKKNCYNFIEALKFLYNFVNILIRDTPFLQLCLQLQYTIIIIFHDAIHKFIMYFYFARFKPRVGNGTAARSKTGLSLYFANLSPMGFFPFLFGTFFQLHQSQTIFPLVFGHLWEQCKTYFPPLAHYLSYFISK